MKTGLKSLVSRVSRRHAAFVTRASGTTIVVVEVARTYKESLSRFRVLFITLWILMLSFMPSGRFMLVPPVLMAVFFGGMFIRRVTVIESGRALATLPVTGQKLTLTLWALAVLVFPLFYGAVQLPIRILLDLLGSRDMHLVGWLPFECLLGMGLGGAFSLASGFSAYHLSSARRTTSSAHALGKMAVGLYLLAIFEYCFLAARPGTPNDTFILALAVFSAALLVASYRLAGWAWGPAAISQRPANPGAGFIADMSRFRAGSLSFMRYWLVEAPRSLLSCVVSVAVIVLLHPYLAPFAAQGSRLPVTIDLALILIVLTPAGVASFAAFIDPRTIRSLPFSRAHQTVLVFTVGAPHAAPLCVVAVCWGWMSGWPWLTLAGVVAIEAGLYMLAVALSFLWGMWTLVLVMVLGGLPLFAIGALPPITRPIVLLPAGLITANIAYAVLYNQLAYGTALYRRKTSVSGLPSW